MKFTPEMFEIGAAPSETLGGGKIVSVRDAVMLAQSAFDKWLASCLWDKADRNTEPFIKARALLGVADLKCDKDYLTMQKTLPGCKKP